MSRALGMQEDMQKGSQTEDGKSIDSSRKKWLQVLIICNAYCNAAGMVDI